MRLEGAKTVILLSHLNSNRDREIAEKIQGIDGIVGGHDHVKISPPLEVNGAVIVQAGDFGQYLGRLDLTIDPETGKVARYQGTLIPVGEDIPDDPQTWQAVEAQQRRVEQMMRHQIGYLNGPLELAADQECSAGNLLADALLERMVGMQAAMVLAGHWNKGLEAGPITQGALYAANRSTANPARAKLTGAQIRQFLREALKLENARAVSMPCAAGRSGCRT